jgi:hypothetical protein
VALRHLPRPSTRRQRRRSVIDHLIIGVRDAGVSRAFYAKALAPLGVEVLFEHPTSGIGFGVDGKPAFFVAAREPSRRVAATTDSPVCGLSTTPPTTARSCSIRTTTTSKPSATTARDGISSSPADTSSPVKVVVAQDLAPHSPCPGLGDDRPHDLRRDAARRDLPSGEPTQTRMSSVKLSSGPPTSLLSSNLPQTKPLLLWSFLSPCSTS